MNTSLLRTSRLFRTASVLIALMISSSALADGTKDMYPETPRVPNGYSGDYKYRSSIISSANSDNDVNNSRPFPTYGTV